MLNGFGRSLFFSTAAVFFAGAVHAQDAGDLFQQGVRLLELNKADEALAKFQEAVAANPSGEEAYKLWKDTKSRVWSAMMVQGDEFTKIAKHFLRLAQLERKRMSADADTIKALVADAISSDYNKRNAATVKLMSEHGEYAVPFLLDALGNADEDDQQTFAILALDRIGRPATLPLIAALGSDNAVTRRNACAALVYINDSRALPALKRLAEKDADANTREIAQRAVAKIGGANVAGALELYLAHSERYLAQDPMLMSGNDIRDGLWSLEGGKLVHRAVPASLIAYEMAKDSAYGALELEPTNEQGRVLLVKAGAAEMAVVSAESADDEVKALKASVEMQNRALLSAGLDVYRKAYTDMVAKMPGLAPYVLQGLSTLEDPKALAGSPVAASLSHPDKRVRYGAAFALAKNASALNTEQKNALVSALSQAVTEQSRRIVKVIHPEKSTRQIAEEASSAGEGLVVEASASATNELLTLAQFPPDVLVINEKLDSVLVDTMLKWIKDKPRLRNTKLVLVTKDKSGAEEIYGDRVQAYVQAPMTAVALRGAIDSVLQGVELGANRKEADKVAANAAFALSSLDPASFPVADASSQLLKAAGRSASIAVASLRSLGSAAGAGQLAGIVGILKKAKDKPEIAAAAADAIGRILARIGQVDQASVDALIEVVRDTDVDGKVKSAALAALGRAPILPGTRAAILKELRVSPKTGGEEG